MKNPSKVRHLRIVLTNRLNEELSQREMLALKFQGAPPRREAADLISAPRTPKPAPLTHNPFALALSGFKG
jgi:hypothetical protein